MNNKPLSGMFAALMTGLDDTGAFAPERQTDLTHYVQRQGLRGLYVGGSSAESGLLDRHALMEQQAIVRSITKGTEHILIAHIGMPSQADSIQLARHAHTLGYDALSALPPFGYPYTDEEIFRYYRDIASATPLPLIVYEIPLRTGRELPMALLQRILSLTNVVGIKFTSTDLYKLALLKRHQPEKLYYFGFDEIFTSAAILGIDGGIGTTYNLFGRLYVAIWQAIQANDWSKARELQGISQEFVELLLQTGVLAGMKVALRLGAGVDCGPVCAPLTMHHAEPENLLRPFLNRDDVKRWLECQ